MSRRTPGIHERNGRIRISYDLGADPVTGERRQRWETLPRGTTRREASRIRARKVADVGDGVRPDPGQLTLGAYLTDWIERFRMEHPDTRTWYSWRNYLRKHLIPLIGGVRLARLDTSTIAAAYAKITPRMVRYVHAALHRALEDAVREGLIARNWAHGATKPPKPDVARGASKNVWSEAELSTFLAAARFDDRLGYTLWRTFAVTGCRMGEVLGLAPEDVDLNRGTITIRQQYSLAAGKPTVRAPKTRPSRRVIDVDAATLKLLGSHLKRRDERRAELKPLGLWTEGFLFCRDDGSAIHPRSFQTRFKELAGRAGVRSITPHGVRHTAATILLRQGRSVAYVATRLGHTPEVLLKVYAHVLEQDGAEAARGFADAIDGAL